jgi:diaminopimelate epimerase
MRIGFHKMSGAGNDFVVLDGNPLGAPDALPALAAFLCSRRESIGADGILVVERGEGADARVLYYNADGSRAGMCGNGARCAARRARELSLGGDEMVLDFWGTRLPVVVGPDTVRVGLGAPRDVRLHLPLTIEDRELTVHFVNTGVPHAVLEVASADRAPLETLGPVLRRHPAFGAEGANVDFVEIPAQGPLLLRTFERGVEGETLACGTGAAATALVTWWLGKRAAPVALRTRGGHQLRVHIHAGAQGPGAEVDQVWLEGEARTVFRGEIELPARLEQAGTGNEDGAKTAPGVSAARLSAERMAES